MQTALPAEPRSAGEARRFVTHALHALGLESHSDLAELLVSELVTNAILHARTPFTVSVSAHSDKVRVDVVDTSTNGVLTREYSDEATTGRGLSLVDALASAWGTKVTEGGKVVWFELSSASGTA